MPMPTSIPVLPKSDSRDGPEGTLVLGIDAGGTSVRVALASAATGTVIAEQVAPAAPQGGPGPLRLLIESLQHSARNKYTIVAVCAGLAKVSRAGVKESWERELAVLLPDTSSRQCVPDYVIAFHGALPLGIGVSLIAGTGSVAYGENSSGQVSRIGGRGWEYGDEGSGAWLTTELVRRTIRACDGLQLASSLTDAVCDALGTRDAALFAEAARQRAEEAGRGFLVPLVLAQAREGQEEAADLFVGAAAWLSLLARVTAASLNMTDEPELPIALAGGMWEAGDLILRPFERILARHLPKARVVRGEANALMGAVRLAQRAVRA